MKALISLLALVVVAACAAPVYHPTKGEAAMQADVDACTEASVLSSALRVAAMEDVFACLKEKGYKKMPRQAAPARAPAPPPAPKPCAVPCKG